MDRRFPILAAALAALAASSACQDYNFNPVGHCVIQPGTRRVTLSSVSTADVLFVVDDSGSMGAEQANLAAQFGTFIDILSDSNVDRVANGLDPTDFHVAVTTTSMFRNPRFTNGSYCNDECPGREGRKVCCLGPTGATAPQPPYCRVDADCDSTRGFTCRTTTECGAAAAVGGRGCFDAACAPQPIPCTTVGAECGNFQPYYEASVGTCSSGYAADLFTTNDEYPKGRFMVNPAAAYPGDPNDVVLHFDKGLYCTWDEANGVCTGGGTNTTAINNLIAQFNQNVQVGVCGSLVEQGIEAARAAIERARGNLGGQTAGYVPGEFLHPNSKLVVVWVTDEDDCSSPASAADGVVFWDTGTSDACRVDASLPEAQQRQFAISAYADYFTSLGRPFGAAFIASLTNGCEDLTCTPALCCGSDGSGYCGSPGICTTASCGGQGLPARYVTLANELRAKGAEVVLGSVCDEFGASLGRIAEIVKPPPSLTLPTQPAATEVTILRIAGSGGVTRKTCSRPAPPPPAPIPAGDPGSPCDLSLPANVTANAAAQAYIDSVKASYDWWFTAASDQICPYQRLPSAASRFVYINHETGNCEANPGETYSLDYIGRLPANGCTSVADCTGALGGTESDWTCFAGVDVAGACLEPAADNVGTCICGSFEKNCPNG